MDLILFFFIFIFFFPLLILLLSITSNKKTHQLHLPPGPKPWPILGNIPQIMANPKTPHITFSKLSQSHGPLISIRLGSQLTIVASSFESASQILKTHDRNFAARYLPKSNPFELNVLERIALAWAPTCGNGWRSLRALCGSELFSPRTIEAQSAVRERKVGEMVDFLCGQRGGIVNLGEIVFATVFNFLCNLFFSRDLLGLAGEDDHGAKSHFMKMKELAVASNVADFFPILDRFDPQGMRKKTLNVFGKTLAVWDRYVKERREIRKSDIEGDTPKEDFLDVFLANGFDDLKINWLFMELLNAGTDTTTKTIEWAMAELLKNREIMVKLREEINREIGPSNPITESKTSQLTFLNACIKETLRLHPPAPFLIPRRALETCEVMNYRIPKGSQVIVNVWAIGRDPAVWVDPLSFKPERFIDGSVLADFKGRDFEFLPFGSGRRMCPGLPMAAKQLPLILASLVRGFDWSLPDGLDPTELDMGEKFGLTLQKDQPLVLVVDTHCM